MPYVIAEPCIGVKDTACIDVCPCDCIHPTTDEPEFSSAPHLYINPDECIDCGACIPVCPISAIFPLEELPKQWEHFAEVNARWYAGKRAGFLRAAGEVPQLGVEIQGTPGALLRLVAATEEYYAEQFG